MTFNTVENEKIEKKLISIINKAISEVNVTYIRKKTKVTNTEYDDELKKPVNEVIEETETVEKVMCEYDINKLKSLTELWIKLKNSNITTVPDSEQCSGGVIILPETSIIENYTEDNSNEK